MLSLVLIWILPLNIIHMVLEGSVRLRSSLIMKDQSHAFTWFSGKLGNPFDTQTNKHGMSFTSYSGSFYYSSQTFRRQYEMIVSVIPHFFIKYLSMYKISSSFNVLCNPIISPIQPVKCVFFKLGIIPAYFFQSSAFPRSPI